MLRYHLASTALLYHRLRRVLMRRKPLGFRFVLFHDIPEKDEDSLRQFIDIVRNQHGILSPQEAERVLQGELQLSHGQTPCIFTFDDGFSCNYRVARNILEPMGITALFFVCPGLIDTKTDDQQKQAIADGIFAGRNEAAATAANKSLMTWDQIRALHARGHTIGSHGSLHKRLSTLNGADLSNEINIASQRLLSELGEKVKWYAYAFGDVDSVSTNALAEIAKSHTFCRSGVRGLNNNLTNQYAIRADSIDLSAPPAYHSFILQGGLDMRYRIATKRLDQMSSDTNSS